MRNSKKNLDFEVDLLPIIGIMGLCIGILLLTAVFINISTIDISQAVGDRTQDSKQNPPAVQASFNDNGELIMMITESKVSVPSNLNRVKIGSTSNGQIDWSMVEAYATAVKEALPEINTALVMPKASSGYEEIIRVMDLFRKADFKDVGVSPL
jgi:biopolymer transport protein TolR